MVTCDYEVIELKPLTEYIVSRIGELKLLASKITIADATRKVKNEL